MPENSFQNLKEKYADFSSPIMQVFINERQLDAKHKSIKPVSSIKVQLTAGYEAGMALFSIYNVYDYEKGCFKFSEFQEVQIGAPIAAFLGYGDKLEPVFRGYIASLRFKVEKEGGQVLEVAAMDVKGLMMSNNNSFQMKGKKYSECIKSLFTSDSYKDILKEAYYIDDTPEEALKADGKDMKTIDLVEESDYEFIVKAAKKFAYDFYSDGSMLYFRKPKSNNDVFMEIGIGTGAVYMELEFSMNGLVNEVEVRSSNPADGKLFVKKATITGNYNTTGSPASKLLSKSRKTYIDPTIDSTNMADLRAQAVVEQIQYRFGNFSMQCIGIPELRPGRFIDVEGLMEGKKVACYIDSVTHVFDSKRGYVTELKGRMKEFPR
ncbi:MAG: hypothetical protein K6F52_06770 [Clostridia bacterium]|nr:hypothetical protein [Clostridia bacterium]